MIKIYFNFNNLEIANLIINKYWREGVGHWETRDRGTLATFCLFITFDCWTMGNDWLSKMWNKYQQNQKYQQKYKLMIYQSLTNTSFGVGWLSFEKSWSGELMYAGLRLLEERGTALLLMWSILHSSICGRISWWQVGNR